MKKHLLFLTVFVTAFATSGFGKSFYDPLYNSKTINYQNFFKSNLNLLTNRDEDSREAFFEKIQKLTKQTKRAGDSFFIYQVLTDFILAPSADENINDLRERALEYLVEELENDESTISKREFVVAKLSQIAISAKVFEFDQNEKAANTLITFAEDENLILRHAAITGLKAIALKSEEKWENLASEAVSKISTGIDSDNLEIQRISIYESMDVIRKAELATDATKSLWEETGEGLSAINSPSLQAHVKSEIEKLTKLHSGSAFKEQVDEVKQQLRELESIKKTASEPVTELLSILKEEEDAADIEAALDSIMGQVSKGRSFLNKIYAKIAGIILSSENSEYKIRTLNNNLIDLTHSSQSPLYFYRTALFFIGEISVFQNNQKAIIPISSLANLMASTDYEGLIKPVIQEIRILVNSDLPIWVSRRLIGLIFIQAGDSPNEATAMASAKALGEIALGAKNGVLRWEARKRLQYLSKFAKDSIVKQYSADWK